MRGPEINGAQRTAKSAAPSNGQLQPPLPPSRSAIHTGTWSTAGPRAGVVISVLEDSTLGLLPALTVVGASGLVLVALAFTGSRAGAAWAEGLFWLGLSVLLLPIAARLVSEQATRRERIGLVVFLGLALYLVKVMHDPTAFAFPDELVHQYNVQQVLESQRLFNTNPLLPVTPLYPGLSVVTGALASMTGLTDFSAGILVIGAARLILTLALFLFLEQASSSMRVAGLGTLLYMANANFVFFSAAYAYESLSLPLAILVIFAVGQSERDQPTGRRIGYTIAALIVLMAVVVTHHLASYILVTFLFGLALLIRALSRGRRAGPWLLALFGLAAVLGWLLFVAAFTFSYLAPVGGGALRSVFGVFTGVSTIRELFRAQSGQIAPLWQRFAGIGSVLLILIGLPFGMWEIWRRQRRNPFALILAAAVLVYLATLPLRFFPEAWETANRASEYVFMGVAFVLALAIVWITAHRTAQPLLVGTLVGAIAIIFAGGLIAGWEPNALLARPYVVSAGGALLEPAGVSAAKWTRSHINPGSRFASDPSNSHLLLTFGGQYPLEGEANGIRATLLAKHIDQSIVDILHTANIRYVLMDRRMISSDQLVGVYFDRAAPSNSFETRLYDASVYGKFDSPFEVSRIYDAGNIVIYDVGVLSGLLPTR